MCAGHDPSLTSMDIRCRKTRIDNHLRCIINQNISPMYVSGYLVTLDTLDWAIMNLNEVSVRSLVWEGFRMAKCYRIDLLHSTDDKQNVFRAIRRTIGHKLMCDLPNVMHVCARDFIIACVHKTLKFFKVNKLDVPIQFQNMIAENLYDDARVLISDARLSDALSIVSS